MTIDKADNHENKRRKINDNEEDGFVWNKQMYHVTLNGHIDPSEYLEWIITRIGKRKLVHYSIVNEVSDSNHAYEHTHAALKFDRAPNWTNSKILFHPACLSAHYDVEPINSKQHWDQLFLKYHRGYKKNKNTNEEKYIEPVKLLQSNYDPDEKSFHDQVAEYIRNCDRWKDVLEMDGSFGKYIALRLSWARETWLHRKIRIPSDIDDLYQWQKDLVNELKAKPNKRNVIWYIDRIGGKGKSELAKYLVQNMDAFLAQGKSDDILFAYNGEPIVVFDIPRSTEHISWHAIEAIKNGLYMNRKYVSCMKGFKIPHVVCFSNEEPDLSKLSKDRWDIRYCDPSEHPDAIRKKEYDDHLAYLNRQFGDDDEE